MPRPKPCRVPRARLRAGSLSAWTSTAATAPGARRARPRCGAAWPPRRATRTCAASRCRAGGGGGGGGSLVRTPTAERNLEAAALALCQQRPLLLEGPPGALPAACHGLAAACAAHEGRLAVAACPAPTTSHTVGRRRCARRCSVKLAVRAARRQRRWASGPAQMLHPVQLPARLRIWPRARRPPARPSRRRRPRRQRQVRARGRAGAPDRQRGRPHLRARGRPDGRQGAARRVRLHRRARRVCVAAGAAHAGAPPRALAAGGRRRGCRAWLFCEHKGARVCDVAGAPSLQVAAWVVQ